MGRGVDLRKQHPNFWLVVVGDFLTLSWLGIANTFIVNTSPAWRVIEQVASMRTFGITFMALSCALLYGIFRSVWVFRLSLSLAAGAVALFGIGLGSVVVSDVIATGRTPGAGGPAMYFFFAICLVAQSREPRTNPDAVSR